MIESFSLFNQVFLLFYFSSFLLFIFLCVEIKRLEQGFVDKAQLSFVLENIREELARSVKQEEWLEQTEELEDVKETVGSMREELQLSLRFIEWYSNREKHEQKVYRQKVMV